MKLFRATLTGLLLAGGCGLFAGDYDALIKTLKANWPDSKEAVVVCDLELSRFAVTELASATRAAGITLQAVNVKTDKDVDTAKSSIKSMRPDFIVLVDSDPVLGTQGKLTKSFIASALIQSIPSVGTHADYLKVGGVLAVGPKTEGKVVASGRLIKSLRLKVPEGSTLQ